jgi:hypothetical protein
MGFMNRTNKTLERIVIAWFVALLVYGFIKFPDAPYSRCSAAEGYCGKSGKPHTKSEHEALKIWEKTLFGSAIVAAAVGSLIAWPMKTMERRVSIAAPARTTKPRDQSIASFRKRRIQAIRLYSLGGLAAALSMAAVFFTWPVWLTCTIFAMAVVLGICGDRRGRCPFCRKPALNDENFGTDATKCPHCFMRLP